MPWLLTSSPLASVDIALTRIGLPKSGDFLSILTPVAQFTAGSNFSATSSSPAVRAGGGPGPGRAGGGGGGRAGPAGGGAGGGGAGTPAEARAAGGGSGET